jgi:hypothetical protein
MRNFFPGFSIASRVTLAKYIFPFCSEADSIFEQNKNRIRIQSYLTAILNFTAGSQGCIPLGGMFTPSFTPWGEHSLMFRRMEGRTENFTPGDKFYPCGPEVKLRIALWVDVMITKTNIIFKFSHKTSCSLSKKPLFFAKCLGENILKIIILVPGSEPGIF